jgi:hypothetical protein
METTHEIIDAIVAEGSPHGGTQAIRLLAIIAHSEIERKKRFDEMFKKFDPLLDSLKAYIFSQIEPPQA